MDPVRDFAARYEERWQQLRSAADALGEGGLERQTASGWTAKEMLAHVAFWEEAAPYVIEHMLRGKPDPEHWVFPSGYDPFAVEEDWPADTVHNAREGAWAREQSVATVLQRMDRAHAPMLELLATLTPEELEQHGPYLESLHGHFAEHLAELEPLQASATQGQG